METALSLIFVIGVCVPCWCGLILCVLIEYENRSKFEKSVIIFAFVGAPIGWIAYGVASPDMSLVGSLELYLIGAIPAVIAGMGFGVIIARKRLGAPLGAAVGLIAGVVSTFVYFYCAEKLGYSMFIPWFEAVGVGGFAGAVCGYQVSWIINRKQPRDLSSAPVAPPVSLHDAVWNGSWGTAKRLLQQGAEVNQVNPKGKTALDIARARDDKQIIDLLLTYGATDHRTSQENQMMTACADNVS
jgi:hypothetical protein